MRFPILLLLPLVAADVLPAPPKVPGRLNPLDPNVVPDEFACVAPAGPVFSPGGPVGLSQWRVPEVPLEADCRTTLVKNKFHGPEQDSFVGEYTVPPCMFNRIILNLTAHSSPGLSPDRLATLHIGDVEIWRTTTAQPRPHAPVTWTAWKDVTPYRSLFNASQPVRFTVHAEDNITADAYAYTSVLRVEIEASFFLWQPRNTFRKPTGGGKWPPSEETEGVFPRPRPADVVMPIGDAVTLPRNIHRAHVGVAATAVAGGDDEFWWAHVPDRMSGGLGPEVGAPLPGGSAFREVQLYIDEQLAGIVWPFPLVRSGGVAPPLHRPLLPLQALDVRDLEMDISPWVGYLSDGQEHHFTLRAYAVDDSVSPAKLKELPAASWSLNGKVFLWLDRGLPSITNGSMPLVSKNTVVFDQDANSARIEDNGELEYEEKLKRFFEIKGQVIAASRQHEAVVEQTFFGRSWGRLSAQGITHVLYSNYDGNTLTKLDGVEDFYSNFQYPIKARVTYGKTDDCEVTIDANLTQHMSVSARHASALHTGIELWREYFDPGRQEYTSGISSTEWRQGHALFCDRPSPGMSTGSATVEGGFKLGAYNAYFGRRSGYWPDPEFYSRAITTVNETVVADSVELYKLTRHYEFRHDQNTPLAIENASATGPDGYAPLGARALMGKFVPADGQDDDEEENGDQDIAQQGISELGAEFVPADVQNDEEQENENQGMAQQGIAEPDQEPDEVEKAEEIDTHRQNGGHKHITVKIGASVFGNSTKKVNDANEKAVGGR